MFQSRRDFIKNSSILSLGLGAAALVNATDARAENGDKNKQSSSGIIVPVETPDLKKLPFTIEAGVKVFHLHAQTVDSARIRDAVTRGYAAIQAAQRV